MGWISWEAVTALSTVAGTAFVVAAGTAALRTLRELQKQNRMAGTMALFEIMESAMATEARRALRLARSEIVEAGQSDDVLSALDRALVGIQDSNGDPLPVSGIRDAMNAMEQAAVLALHGMVPFEVERTYFSTVVASSWQAVEPYALAVRKGRNNPTYLQHLEALSEFATEEFHDRSWTSHRRQAIVRLVRGAADVNTKSYGSPSRSRRAYLERPANRSDYPDGPAAHQPTSEQAK